MEKLILLRSLIPNFDIPSQFFCFVYAADTSYLFLFSPIFFSQWLWSSVGELCCQGLIPSHKNGSSLHFDYIKIFFPQVSTKSHNRFWEHQEVKSLGIETWTLEQKDWVSMVVLHLSHPVGQDIQHLFLCLSRNNQKT